MAHYLKQKKISNAEIINRVHKEINQKKEIIKLVLSEYVRIVTREVLKGNKIYFPKNFGSIEIISLKMTNFLAKYFAKSSAIVNTERQTKILFTITAQNKYKLVLSATGQIIASIKIIIYNRLKQYRYVDQ